MIEAELPDGTILEFPDDIDPEVMKRSIKKFMKVPVDAPTDTPVPPPSLSMLDVGQQAIQNFPKSALQAGKDIITPLTEPVETAKALGNLGLGVIQKAIPGRQESEKYADTLGEYFSDRYVKQGAIKRTIANDPAGFLLDLSTVLS